MPCPVTSFKAGLGTSQVIGLVTVMIALSQKETAGHNGIHTCSQSQFQEQETIAEPLQVSEGTDTAELGFNPANRFPYG